MDISLELVGQLQKDPRQSTLVTVAFCAVPKAAAVGLLLEEPPRPDWDSLGGPSMVVADKFATNASNGGGDELLMPSYVFSWLFPFWKNAGSP